jgi:serpin B
MSKTLHFPYPQDRRHPAVNINELKLSELKRNISANCFKLKVANSLWGQKDYSFQPSFLSMLAENFKSKLQLVDFKNDTERQQAVSDINQWVSQSTEGMINQLVSSKDLSVETRLILANAIYFKAKWKTPFLIEKTDNDEFILLTGNKVTVPMMHSRASFNYAKSSEYQAVELPYKGKPMSMVIVMPQEGQFESVEKTFNYPFVEQVLAKLKSNELVLSMPKLKFEAQFSLGKTLEDMGMLNAFKPDKADFSGMAKETEQDKLYISEVIHKAVIEVEETGTKAAAASGVIAYTSEIKEKLPEIMLINKPFLFFIRDIESGIVLFIGRVMNPSLENQSVNQEGLGKL